MMSFYADVRSDGWQDGLLPLCDWGGGAWASCDSVGHIFTMEGPAITKTAFSLKDWFETWLSDADMQGETFEMIDTVVKNPFTKRNFVMKQRGKAKGTTP